MGVYQKYKDKNGKPYGPWFMKYPCGRDGATGKIKYRIAKVGPSRRLALVAFQKKQVEFAEKKYLDVDERREMWSCPR